MNITIFSTTNCAVCHQEMKWLDSMGATYTNIVVDETDEGMEKLLQETGGVIQGTPFTILEDDGKKDTIVGFDRKKLSTLLGY